MARNARAAWARAYVRVVGLSRDWSWLAFSIFLPLLQMSAFVFIYKALHAPAEYLGYVVLGGAMTSYWVNVLWAMATQFYWEKESGNLQLFLMAPISRMAILLGMAFGGFVSTSLHSLSALTLGIVIFHVRFSLTDPLMTAAVFLVTLFALYSLGMMAASLYLYWGREAYHLTALFQEPVFLLAGFYFPVRNLGFWTAAAASIIPATLGLDALRQLLFPEARQGFLPVAAELWIVVALGVLFFLLARKTLARMEELGKRDGKVTLRWE